MDFHLNEKFQYIFQDRCQTHTLHMVPYGQNFSYSFLSPGVEMTRIDKTLLTSTLIVQNINYISMGEM